MCKAQRDIPIRKRIGVDTLNVREYKMTDNKKIKCILGILYFKTVYNSPSVAAAAIAKHTMNGWTIWKYERAPGDWLLLDNLRKKK